MSFYIYEFEYLIETLQNAAAVHYMDFKGEAAVNCSQYDYEDYEDVELYRRFRFLSKQGPGALDTDMLTEVRNLTSEPNFYRYIDYFPVMM